MNSNLQHEQEPEVPFKIAVPGRTGRFSRIKFAA